MSRALNTIDAVRVAHLVQAALPLVEASPPGPARDDWLRRYDAMYRPAGRVLGVRQIRVTGETR